MDTTHETLESKLPLAQRQWRRIGIFSLLAAGGMAVFAAATGLLRDSVYLAGSFLSPEISATDDGWPTWFILVFWGAFGAAILSACYMAFIDIRYIRLTYLMSQRQLFRDIITSERTAGVKIPGSNGKDN